MVIEDVVKSITRLFTANYENEDLRTNFRNLLQHLCVDESNARAGSWANC